MGTPKNLNEPAVYVEALVRAVLEPDLDRLACWLADDDNAPQSPFFRWYQYFAERLQDLAPRPELGFLPRPKQASAPPKVGRNDPCPCGSGKKFKSCHIDDADAVAWKLASPTPAIRSMAVANLIGRLPLATLDEVPTEKASALARTEMAFAYYRADRLAIALDLLKTVLDGDRDDEDLLYDFLIATYGDWLLQAQRPKDAENFLLDEFDQPRGVEKWQVAQKLAALYLDRGDPDSAGIWVDSAMDGDNQNPFNHYLQGLLHHTVENWDAAVASYEQARAFSDQFREQERVQMLAIVAEGLDAARNHRPLEDQPDQPPPEAGATAQPSD